MDPFANPLGVALEARDNSISGDYTGLIQGIPNAVSLSIPVDLSSLTGDFRVDSGRFSGSQIVLRVESGTSAKGKFEGTLVEHVLDGADLVERRVTFAKIQCRLD